MSNKSEATIQSEILIEVNKRGHRLYRSNAGKIKTSDNTFIQLFPKGFPDTCGFRKGDGKFIAIEVKNTKGKLRPEQEKFAAFAMKQPIIYGVARSVDDAIRIIEGGELMYTETETFYGATETDLENNIHGFLDQTGFSFVEENRYVGEDGEYISEVKYTYTLPNV